MLPVPILEGPRSGLPTSTVNARRDILFNPTGVDAGIQAQATTQTSDYRSRLSASNSSTTLQCAR